MTDTKESQLASAVLMIRPATFQSNPWTAASNKFQGRNPAPPEQQQAQAAAAFERLALALTDGGIRVIAIDDTPEPETPDAIFPNNWVSTHGDGTVVLYPMAAPNRRTERRMEIIDSLATEHGYAVRRIVDLTAHENKSQFLEGTGSLVLDRVNRIAYACHSSRTHLDALGDFAQQLDYEVLAFDAFDRDGAPVYHTNVLMSVGDGLAVICDAAISRDDQRDAVLHSLRSTGHDLVLLTMDQMDAFAGNMLALRDGNGRRVIAMSQQAFNSLNSEQLGKIEAHATVIAAPIDCIESSAGGSVRCMLAEIHLPLF